MSSNVPTYGEAHRAGEKCGREQLAKELAALETNREAVAVLMHRLHQAEDIVDWIAAHFAWEHEKGKRIALNDHIEIHVHEQVALR